MKKNKSQFSFVNIGSSSLLVVFLTLCLSSFAVLSLASARNNYSFSKRFADHKTEYYTASRTAEDILAQIDSLLADTWEKQAGAGFSGYVKALETAYKDYAPGNVPVVFTPDAYEPSVSYEIPLNDKQTLSVELQVMDPEKSEHYYTVRAWQVISSYEWEDEQTLELMPLG